MEKDNRLNKTLEEIIKKEQGKPFNMAAQIWNHTFYWNSMKPKGGGEPNGKVKDLIEKNFGNFDSFKTKFNTVAAGHFGSGWTWLIQRRNGTLEIVDTHDAGCPLTESDVKAILTCDVWEHAYYIDHRNARANYLNNWWNVVNWDFANKNLLKD